MSLKKAWGGENVLNYSNAEEFTSSDPYSDPPAGGNGSSWNGYGCKFRTHPHSRTHRMLAAWAAVLVALLTVQFRMGGASQNPADILKKQLGQQQQVSTALGSASPRCASA